MTLSRKRLESIIHPLVKNEIENFIRNVRYPYCVICIPLLFEAGLQSTVDRTLVVDLPEDLQIKRACARDDEEKGKIEKIMHTQITREERITLADDIIHNDRNISYLKSQVISMHQKYLKISEHGAVEFS